MKALLKRHLLQLAALGAAASLHAQGTAFTYQGRLNQNGTPSTGLYDLSFTAYNGALAPTPASAPITVPAVPVTNGLFMVTLDFGAGLFTGPQRWLEIAVRTNGAASFVALEPRQLVTSVPYATHANTASNVVNGSVVKSLNNLRDNVTLAAGANVTLTPSGNSITIAATNVGGTSGPWALNGASAFYNGGNVGIGTATPASKLTVTSPLYGITHNDGVVDLSTFLDSRGGWLGTVSAHPLHFFTGNGQASLKVDTSGAVGIGTTTPVSRLTVSGSGVFNNPLAAAITLDNTVAGRRWEWHALDDGRMQLADFTAGSSRMMFDQNGSVGIGALSPQAKLHLHEPAGSVSHLIETGGGVNAWTRASFKNLNGQWDIGTSREFNGDQLYFSRLGGGIALGLQPNGDAFLARNVTVGGNVGIGTGNPAAKLDVAGNVVASGNIGIGTATPPDRLYIAGEGASGYAIGIEGNARQNRDKGGWVKAMAKINADGTVARQFSAFGGNITVSHVNATGTYAITFPFQITDRFMSVTPLHNNSVGAVLATVATEGFGGVGPNRVLVSIYDAANGNTEVANEFFIFVF